VRRVTAATCDDAGVRDALIMIDVLSEFRHENADALLESFRERQPAIAERLATARERRIPVIYANDSHGSWEWDTGAWIRRIVETSRAGSLVGEIAPRDGDSLVRKSRYSAFDHTPLEIILREREVERVLLAGAATEMCIVQTAIGARELGLKVTICAEACASVDPRDAETALAYAERVVGARVDRSADGALPR
jgi:nicotinamidase-related amidase